MLKSKLVAFLTSLLIFELLSLKIFRDFLGGDVDKTCLPMQGSQVQFLVWEDSTFCRATKPVYHNY